MFKKLKTLSNKFHKEFQYLKDYEMISDPISPVKVFTHSSKRAIIATRFRKYVSKILLYIITKMIYHILLQCARNYILLVQNEDKLILNVTLALTDGDIERIIGVFEQANVV